MTGTTPIAIALSPDGDSAYVANLYSASISQYTVTHDGSLRAKGPATAPAGVQPQGIVFTDDGSRAYVVNYGSSNISSYSVDGGGRLRALGPPPTPTGEQSEAIALRSTSPGAADRRGLRIVGLQRNPERGTARLIARTRESGRLRLSGRHVRTERRRTDGDRSTPLAVIAKGSKLRKLRKQGWVRVRVEVRLDSGRGETVSRRRQVRLLRIGAER